MDNIASRQAITVLKAHLAPLLPYLDDPAVQEVMINTPENIWVERGGTVLPVTGVTLSEVNIRSAISALAGLNDKSVADILDARMPNIRIAAALHPVAVHGNAMCLRKHSRSKLTLDDYRNHGAFDVVPREAEYDDARPSDDDVRLGGDHVQQFLRWAVLNRKNILISGSTSSGKTTFLNALLAEVPKTDRVLTIEDTAELQVDVPNLVSFESNQEKGVTIRHLVRLALRFRPDRIIVGEIRGAEAYDLLDALNTGHSGGACTMHADSAVLALGRLESMVRMNEDAKQLPLEAMRAQIAGTFQFVIHASRRGGRRGPEEIREITGLREDGFYATKVLFSRFHGGSDDV